MSSKKKVRRYERVPLPKGTPVAWEHLCKCNVSTVSVLAVGGVVYRDAGALSQWGFDQAGFCSGEVRARALVCDSQPGKGMGIECSRPWSRRHVRACSC